MDPNLCMIKLAVKRALNLAHGYIHVDASGIAISRNGKYREKSFLTKSVINNLILHDKPATRHLVKPFSFWADFFKVGPVKKVSKKQRREYTARAKRNGNSKKKYAPRSRIVGLSAGNIAA